jgi:hypothetical protein
MERHSDQALALLEAVLAYRLGQHRELREEAAPEAVRIPLDETLQRFEARYGRLRWIHGAGRAKALFFARLSEALRHQSSGRLTLARRVVEQAIDHGLDQVLAGTDAGSRKFLGLAREVRTEYHRLLSSSILIPDSGYLYAYIEPEHEVADLVAQELGRRHRRDQLMIVTPRECYQVGRGQFIRLTDPNLTRMLRHRALEISAMERYWQRATVRA